jgi:hypothetical protein
MRFEPFGITISTSSTVAPDQRPVLICMIVTEPA